MPDPPTPQAATTESSPVTAGLRPLVEAHRIQAGPTALLREVGQAREVVDEHLRDLDLAFVAERPLVLVGILDRAVLNETGVHAGEQRSRVPLPEIEAAP